eukprot:GFYU01004168.1.p1 GENE.GFYU01004168.1~~GFYU01004168.1.p1  ORF type:complete len:849 (+),score=227.70 GFYU01004168.1:101-2647(+)
MSSIFGPPVPPPPPTPGWQPDADDDPTHFVVKEWTGEPPTAPTRRVFWDQLVPPCQTDNIWATIDSRNFDEDARNEVNFPKLQSWFLRPQGGRRGRLTSLIEGESHNNDLLLLDPGRVQKLQIMLARFPLTIPELAETINRIAKFFAFTDYSRVSRAIDSLIAVAGLKSEIKPVSLKFIDTGGVTVKEADGTSVDIQEILTGTTTSGSGKVYGEDVDMLDTLPIEILELMLESNLDPTTLIGIRGTCKYMKDTIDGILWRWSNDLRALTSMPIHETKQLIDIIVNEPQLLVPTADEITALRQFNGDQSKLVNAAQFLNCISQMPPSNPIHHLVGIVRHMHFQHQRIVLINDVPVVINAVDVLLQNQWLKSVLHRVLMLSNVLGASAYHGIPAASLPHIATVVQKDKAKAGIPLLELVFLHCHHYEPELLQVPQDVLSLLLRAKQYVSHASTIAICEEDTNQTMDNDYRVYLESVDPGFAVEQSRSYREMLDLYTRLHRSHGSLRHYFCHQVPERGVKQLSELLGMVSEFFRASERAIAHVMTSLQATMPPARASDAQATDFNVIAALPPLGVKPSQPPPSSSGPPPPPGAPPAPPPAPPAPPAPERRSSLQSMINAFRGVRQDIKKDKDKGKGKVKGSSSGGSPSKNKPYKMYQINFINKNMASSLVRGSVWEPRQSSEDQNETMLIRGWVLDLYEPANLPDAPTKSADAAKEDHSMYNPTRAASVYQVTHCGLSGVMLLRLELAAKKIEKLLAAGECQSLVSASGVSSADLLHAWTTGDMNTFMPAIQHMLEVTFPQQDRATATRVLPLSEPASVATLPSLSNDAINTVKVMLNHFDEGNIISINQL